MTTYKHGEAATRNQLLRSFRCWESNHELDQAQLLERLAACTDDGAARDILLAQAGARMLRAKQSMREAKQ